MENLQHQTSTTPKPNPLNVYKGPDSMTQYFDPNAQPPLPLVELPAKLNPFRGENVRIYAKMATALPAQNIKCLPALNMLLNDPSAAHKTIIEQSSGSTATSLGIIARVLYGNDKSRAYVSNKAGLNRIRQLRFFGLNVELYGGPSQPEILDPRGTVRKAHLLGKNDSEHYINPGQYDNESNWTAHIRWTGPQIWKQLPEINLLCMSMGTAGCITGTAMYLKSQKPSVTVLGVCNPVGDPIPGPRTLPLVEMCEFPWKKTVDAVEIVESVDSYKLSMSLSQEGLICGPSSGMNLIGLFRFLQKAKDKGELHRYADAATGEVSCVFVCCDLPYQYLDGYFARLEDADFPPVTNLSLLDIDTDEYDGRWELSAQGAMKMLYGQDWNEKKPPSCGNKIPNGSVNHTSSKPEPLPKVTVIDLRSSQDFGKEHVPGAISSPLANLTAATPNPSDDVETLEQQWKDLKAKCDGKELMDICNAAKDPCLVLCYNGETSRIATALLRARGVEAYSAMGGMMAIQDL